MIEEIKKLKVYDIESCVRTPNNVYYDNIKTVNLDKVMKILDKYNNQPDYKMAWEYMYKWFNQRNPKKDTEDSLKIDNFVINFMNEMIKKYNLGGE